MNIYKKNNILISGLLSSTYSFISKTYSQSKNLFTVASAWGQITFVFQNISQLILYFIEDSITELNIEQATRDYSVRSLARISGYDPKRSSASQGEVVVSWNSSNTEAGGGSVIIRRNTQIRNQQNGQMYTLVIPSDTVTIPLSSQSQPQTFKVVQGIFASSNFTSNGASLLSFNIPSINGQNIDQFYVDAYVNEERWRRYDSFYDIPLNAKGFIVKSGIANGIDVYFGNSFFGQIPKSGSNIRVEFLTNIGIKGNVYSTPNNPLTWKFTDSGTDLYGASLDLNLYLNIVNSLDPDFGTDPDATSLIRIVAPKTSRAFVFANAQSYEIFLNKLAIFSQIQAYSTFDDEILEDDNVVYIYLVPDITLNIASNQDYFSVPIQNFILTASQKARIMNLIEDSGSMIATTVVEIVDPIVKKFVMNIDMTTFVGFDPNTIKQQIRNKISDYMLNLKRRDKIPRSDMVAIIESVAGVDSVYVEFLAEDDQSRLRSLQDTSSTDGIFSYKSDSIDTFGDIIIGMNQLVIFRGGWTDLEGNQYTVSPVIGSLGPINITVRGLPVPVDFNSQLNTITRQSVINK
jgi:hypothetical protein